VGYEDVLQVLWVESVSSSETGVERRIERAGMQSAHVRGHETATVVSGS
jgi:hypothetical protein